MERKFHHLITGIDTLHLTCPVDTRPGSLNFSELDYQKHLLRDDSRRDVHRIEADVQAKIDAIEVRR